MYDYPDFEVDYPQNIFEEFLLETSSGEVFTPDLIIKNIKNFSQSSLVAYADFIKGKMVTGVKGYYPPEQQKKLDGIMKGLAGVKSLAAHIPKDGLVATAALQMNYNKLWSLSEKSLKELIAMDTTDEVQQMMKHAKTLVDGSLLLSMNTAGKRKEPYFTAVASIRQNRGVENILKQMVREGNLEKEGKNYLIGDIVIFIEGDKLILTSNYREYKKSDYGLDSKQLARIASRPLGIFFDVASLLDLAGNQIDKDAENILETFESMAVYTKTSKGIPDELYIEVNMQDKKQNSLKVLWELLQDEAELSDLFSAFGRKKVVPWEEEDQWETSPVEGFHW